MDDAQRRALLARYRDGHRVATEALAGISAAELDAGPAEGWSAREVVHHLADSELTGAIRLRRLLAEAAPTLEGYDEAEFARRLHYRDRPIESALATLAAVRAVTAELVEQLEPADWARAGTHSDSGRYSVETWLQIYAAHAHDHAEQIKRSRVGQA